MPKKQMQSHVGLVPKMQLQKQIKNAYIKGDSKQVKALMNQLKQYK